MSNLKYIYKRIQLRNKHYLKAPLNIKVLLYKNLVSRLTYIKNKNRALQKKPIPPLKNCMNNDRSPEYFHNSSVGFPPSTFWLVALFFVFVTLSEVANCSIKSSVKRLIIDAAFTFCFRSSSSFAAEARN